MFTVLRESPDGMTTDDIGKTMHVVGERISQMEHRAALKMEGVRRVLAGVEAMQAELPSGITIETALPHNEHSMPNHHFITLVLKVTPAEDKRRVKAGVQVRKRT